MIDNMVGIIFPLGWIRVYWSAKIGGGGGDRPYALATTALVLNHLQLLYYKKK